MASTIFCDDESCNKEAKYEVHFTTVWTPKDGKALVQVHCEKHAKEWE